MSKEITLTEALATLKVLRAKRENLIRTGTFIGVSARDKVGNLDKELASKGFQSEFDRLNKMTKQIEEIASKLYEANSLTKVTVGTKTYTLAEAIYRKSNINDEVTRISTLKRAVAQADGLAAKAMEIAEKRASTQIDNLLQGRTKDDGVGAMAITMRKEIIKEEKIELVDPNKLSSYILNAEEELLTFSTSIDVAISLVNATTKIIVDIE